MIFVNITDFSYTQMKDEIWISNLAVIIQVGLLFLVNGLCHFKISFSFYVLRSNYYVKEMHSFGFKVFVANITCTYISLLSLVWIYQATMYFTHTHTHTHRRNVGPPPGSHPMGLPPQTPWQAHFARFPPNRPPPMPRENEQHHMSYHGAPPPPINLPPPQLRLVQGKYSKIKKRKEGKVYNTSYFFV
jgi:hypothetical protein